MLYSRWQLAVSDKPILVNSTSFGCYAVAAASKPAAGASDVDVLFGTPMLRQDGLHSVFASLINSYDTLWMEKRGAGRPTASKSVPGPNGPEERWREIS